MSQKLAANPTPQAAASALSNTQILAPELANRREIPLTAFDFLNGAYNATRRARRVVLILIALILVGGAYVVSTGLRTSLDVNQVDTRLADIQVEKSRLLAEFGPAPEGVSTGDVLARDKDLSQALAKITSGQGDLFTMLAEAASLVDEDVSVLRVTYGFAPSAVATNEDQDGQSPPADRSAIGVSIVLRGADIAAVTEAATRIRQISVLRDVAVDVQGREVVVTGTLALDDPPDTMRQRLVELGVRTLGEGN